MNRLPVSDSEDALMGSWLECVREQLRRAQLHQRVLHQPRGHGRQPGRARWKIEHEGFCCLARSGYHRKRKCGHGSHGLAPLLAALKLFALALHAVLDCVWELWRQGRALAGPRRKLLATPGLLTEWF